MSFFQIFETMGPNVVPAVTPPGDTSGGGPEFPPPDTFGLTYPNHARTLLLNVAAGVLSDPGEEYISPRFAPLVLPGPVQNVRPHLFGTSPDRLGLNYWAYQYLLALHTTELHEFVVSLDPRVTYFGHGHPEFFDDRFFRTTVIGDPGTEEELFLFGDFDISADLSGRLNYSWRVTVDNVQITMVSQYPQRTVVESYVVTDGLSDPHRLPGTTWTVRFPAAAVGGSWTITSTRRPRYGLNDIAADVATMSRADLEQLFLQGTRYGNQEPFVTFRNLWFDHPELLYRLGGLLLATIYHTELSRRSLL